ncbi:hypothetical protein GGR58DRAFT_474462 [Xylaria digitata]|nr:hypothetical protein GGR58DRAFT_474462 [Xylaria digitata]
MAVLFDFLFDFFHFISIYILSSLSCFFYLYDLDRSLCNASYIIMATMDSLIHDILHRLEDMRRTEDILELHKLEQESQALRQDIQATKKTISTTITLLNETKKALRIMSSILECFDGKKAKAESTWVSYWGIAQQCNAVSLEMESVAT